MVELFQTQTKTKLWSHQGLLFPFCFCEPQDKGINLTHIESRPSRMNKDQYEFFISVDSSCSQALDEVIDGLRTQISGHVHELSRNKEKDTGWRVCVCDSVCSERMYAEDKHESSDLQRAKLSKCNEETRLKINIKVKLNANWTI